MVLFVLFGCGERNRLAEPAAAESNGLGPEECFRASAYEPVVMSESRAGDRHGTGVTSFAEVQSSHEAPIEVCGVQGELDWLTQLRCQDGSSPYEGPGAAHASRVGSMGGGGRCGSIIDLYTVTCPEGSLEVYMDLYMCPGEQG